MGYTSNRKEQQYQAALAKAPEQRNWLEKTLVKAGDQRYHLSAMPRSVVAATPTAAQPVQQVIRTYTGKHMDQDFQHDAARMAQAGWHVVSQSYGGTKGPGLGKVVAFGALALLAKKQAAEMTVVYSN